MFEIGSSLREARERQGLDVAELEQRTKIRGKYLRSLEDERFELLPAQTYVKGFLRTYAEALGLDGQLYVDEYNSRFVVGDEDQDRPRRSSVRQPQQRSRRVESRVVLIALGAIALLTIAVIGAWTSGDRNGSVEVARKPTPATRTTPRVPPKGVLLIVSAPRGSSILEIHARDATGPVRYQGTLEKNGTPVKLWARRFWINVASPENLVFTVNGRRVRVPGGSPRVLVVTRAGVRAARTA